ncbi:hypothetical protein OTK49_21560 [Vibrio coralliirubri]|uniref:hypothetical protein n=1 Tax=Vibrio coralliirubri TaxID=1516159 RepID=UPI002284133A|nr:hypothetical protein [Vibrio coralliirubri]MCY9865110.1 hypothetical protein [Vibrio coralliirubri]
MNMNEIFDLLAAGSVETANYLPMEATMFLDVFAMAHDNGEITSTLLAETTDGKNVVLAFIMNDTLYQSKHPEYQPKNQIPELKIH